MIQLLTYSRMPNKLSYRMLQNLKDITGSAVPVRVGGTTANHAIWTPNQKEAIIQNFATPGADQPANATWGPKYLESFQVFPKGTKYTVGITFDSGKKGENASVAEATAFYNAIGKDLFALEVGNEFDGMCRCSRRCMNKQSNVLPQYFLSTATPLHGLSHNTSPNGYPALLPSQHTSCTRTASRSSKQAPLCPQVASVQTCHGVPKPPLTLASCQQVLQRRSAHINTSVRHVGP